MFSFCQLQLHVYKFPVWGKSHVSCLGDKLYDCMSSAHAVDKLVINAKMTRSEWYLFFIRHRIPGTTSTFWYQILLFATDPEHHATCWGSG